MNEKRGDQYKLIDELTITVRDNRGNIAQIKMGGTARQIALEAAWWWGYTITRSEHFSVALNGEAFGYDERPGDPGAEYELVGIGSTV
jgi:hypothetical protein